MGTEDHRIAIHCGRCGLQLFRSPKSVADPIVFCDYCLASGPYEDVVENGKALTIGLLTRDQVTEMLREMAVKSE
jgi:hypothetical protein